MATAHLSLFLSRLKRGMVAETLVVRSDRQLVEEFLARRDEAVLTALVHRHGPMVYRVCWRVLQQEQEAEDAFQATFLVLAQKLYTVRKHDSLASWLHGVARRVALKARAQAALRRRHEEQARVSRASVSLPVPADDVTWQELRTALDAELAQLPEKWRLPLILCYLEGRTQDEAAGHLGWSRTTLQRRLGEACAALGRRLNRRGVGWPAAMSAVLLSDCVAAPAAALVGSTVEAAARIAAGHAAVSGVSAQVAALMEGVLKTMLLTKLKIATALLMVLTLMGAGAVVLTCSLSAADVSAADEPPAKQADQAAVPKSIVGVDQGVQKVVWSPDGKFLAVLVNIYQVEEVEAIGKKRTTLFDDCTLMLWDVDKKEWLPTTVRLDPKVRVLALAVSPDSKTLAFGLQDLKTIGAFDIRLVDVEKGKEKKSFPFGEESLRGIVFTSNDTLAAWGRDVAERSVLKVFDVEMERPKGVVHAKADRDTELTCFAFSSDGKSSALGIDSTIRVGRPGKKETVPLEGHSKPIFSLAFSPDARFLVSGSGDNTVKVWDLNDEQLLHTLTADDQSLNAVALSPDGKTVALGIVTRKDKKVTGHEVKLFDMETGNLKRTLKVTGRVGVMSLAYSPDGRTLAVGGLAVDADYKTLGDLRLWPVGKK